MILKLYYFSSKYQNKGKKNSSSENLVKTSISQRFLDLDIFRFHKVL